MTTQSPITLVQPEAHGRLSGGYLYNAHMAELGVWSLENTSRARLERALESLTAPTLVLDSIWLTDGAFQCFQRQRQRGKRVGAILHSMPSMIEATEAGLPPRALPTEFEWGALAALDFLCVLGPHFQRMLNARGLETLLLPPGIDEKWRISKKREHGGPCRLVSVGAVSPRKGFLDVARALSTSPQGEWSWSVVGSLDVDPAYAAQVQKECSQIRSPKQVEFLGQLPPDEVRRQVQGADLLVMPSYDENHPLVLLEAIASGVPAVAYAAGAARDLLGCGELVFEGGACGEVLEVGDWRGLASVLKELVQDEERRLRLVRGCVERAQSLPSWQQAAEEARRVLSALA